jgi:uncharacterized Zn-binding protein involved in type VI secretion
MRRYNIVHGDTTTAKGIVQAFQSDTTNMGKVLAVIGGEVICPKCKTTGLIVPDGPRLHENFMGREAVLDKDICMCACDPKPRLINSLDCMYQTMTVDEVVAQGFGSWVGVTDNTALQEAASKYFDEQVKTSGILRAGYPFFIETADGYTQPGRVDSSGHLPRIHTNVSENYTIYWAMKPSQNISRDRQCQIKKL